MVCDQKFHLLDHLLIANNSQGGEFLFFSLKFHFSTDSLYQCYRLVPLWYYIHLLCVYTRLLNYILSYQALR